MKAKILTPVVSIFKDDNSFDLDGNLRVMEHLIKGGVDGITPLGSTGEYPTIPFQQKKEYLDYYIDAVEKRVELLPGTGSENTQDTIELSNHLFKHHRNQIKGVLVISEFYFNMSDDDFYRYYAHMADAIDGPIYIYNYPERTGHSISPDVVTILAKEKENIVGIKESVKDFDHTRAILEKVKLVKPEFEVFSGYDNQHIENVKLGGAGGIGALSNLQPQLWAELMRAANKGEYDKLDSFVPKIDKLMGLYALESNPQKIFKSLLNQQGINVSTHCIFPFDYLKDGSLEKGMEIMSSI